MIEPYDFALLWVGLFTCWAGVRAWSIWQVTQQDHLILVGAGLLSAGIIMVNRSKQLEEPQDAM